MVVGDGPGIIAKPDHERSRNASHTEGSVVAASIIRGLGCDVQALGHGDDLIRHRPAAIDEQSVVARSHHIELQHGDGVVERVDGVSDVMDRAQQALLLGIPGRKQHRAAGNIALFLPDPGYLQYRSDARGIVVGSDPGRAIGVLAQMVVVPAQNDDFVHIFGISAGQHAQHIAPGCIFIDGDGDGDAGGGGQ